jgi:2-enoate reductase
MEESVLAAKFLQDAGYDMLNCDNGTYDAWYWAHPPVYMPENCNLEDVEALKPHVDIPLVCAGRMDPRTAADAIAEGKLDAAGFARNFLADQAWVTKLMEGREDEIRPCILCHNGCFNMAHYKGVPNDQDLSDSLNMSRCAVNAETMQWDKHYIRRTSSPKKVAIIGGGIGGMEAARVLKLRGHEPVIYEKNGMLGGTFIAASAESYKGRMRALLDWYRKQMTDLGVEIHLNTEVKDLSQFDGMPLIVSTGSTPIRLGSVKGFDRTVEACDYLLGKEVGQKVAVIGGGLTGCEIAYELFLQGKEPIIIEMKDDLIAQKGVCLANSSYLREFFEWKKVPVYLETTLREVREGSVVCTGKDGKEVEIPCDSVIGAVGYRPAPMDVKGRSQTWLIGDCSGVGNLRTVVWSAYEAAMKV